jgi:hypothetical protein
LQTTADNDASASRKAQQQVNSNHVDERSPSLPRGKATDAGSQRALRCGRSQSFGEREQKENCAVLNLPSAFVAFANAAAQSAQRLCFVPAMPKFAQTRHMSGLAVHKGCREPDTSAAHTSSIPKAMKLPLMTKAKLMSTVVDTTVDR